MALAVFRHRRHLVTEKSPSCCSGAAGALLCANRFADQPPARFTGTYLSIVPPTRERNGAPQSWQFTCRLGALEAAFTWTSLYGAPQFGHWKRVVAPLGIRKAIARPRIKVSARRPRSGESASRRAAETA